MRNVCIVLLSIFIVMETFSQNRPSDRMPVAAGRFYEADKESLTESLASLFKSCRKLPDNPNVRAIISPHAGYVYSGSIAAAAFSAVDNRKKISNIFLIGSSHVMALDGASVYYSGDMITPLGKVTVNKEIANKLKDENRLFNNSINAHLQEHSLEVQLPFIQYRFSNTPPVIPIIIGTTDISKLKKIAEVLRPYFTNDNLFIFSSDFSHYPDYKTANEVDNRTAKAIVTGDPQQLIEILKKNEAEGSNGLVTSMCGWTSGLVLLYLSQGERNLEFRMIDYCNSGDSKYGTRDEVVGYHAIALIDKTGEESASEVPASEIYFSVAEKEKLLSIARNNIRSLLYDRKMIHPDEKTLPESFRKSMGAFVTLKIKGKLRGCIGQFVSSDPLYEVVLQSSRSSAFDDPRFTPLTKEEFAETDIEITVLGPLRKINSINEIVLGKHGIYIKKDFRSGTMLPQVATENGWSVDEFLGYTSRDKAGLGWEGWKNADLYIYEGIVIEEKKK